jgi:hypothetical protein
LVFISMAVQVVELFVDMSSDGLIFVLRMFGFLQTRIYAEAAQEARDVSDFVRVGALRIWVAPGRKLTGFLRCCGAVFRVRDDRGEARVSLQRFEVRILIDAKVVGRRKSAVNRLA